MSEDAVAVVVNSLHIQEKAAEMTIEFISSKRSFFSYFVTACRAMMEETGRFEPSERGWLTCAARA